MSVCPEPLFSIGICLQRNNGNKAKKIFSSSLSHPSPSPLSPSSLFRFFHTSVVRLPDPLFLLFQRIHEIQKILCLIYILLLLKPSNSEILKFSEFFDSYVHRQLAALRRFLIPHKAPRRRPPAPSPSES